MIYTIVDLQQSYHDATRGDGLIDFTKRIRTPKNDLSGKFSVGRDDLSKLFSKQVWHEIKTKSGHRKIQHRVTGVVVEYANHGKMDPGAVQTIFEQVQKHLNIFCNDIFLYKENHWKDEPNYQDALKNLVLQKSKRKTNF